MSRRRGRNKQGVTGLLGLATIVTLVLPLMSSACVHTRVERVGRMVLGHGSEGLAPVLQATEDDLTSYEEVATINVDMSAVRSSQRGLRHLRRKASLLGCDAITKVSFTMKSLVGGVCLRSAKLNNYESTPSDLLAETASPSLRRRVASAANDGQALAMVLSRVDHLSPQQRVWPLQWYLKRHPQSPFADDIRAMIKVKPRSRKSSEAAGLVATR